MQFRSLRYTPSIPEGPERCKPSMSSRRERSTRSSILSYATAAISIAAVLVITRTAYWEAFCASSTEQISRSVAIRAFKRPTTGYVRRPLRPSKYGDGPEKEGEGRGEWQGDDGKFTVNFGDPRNGRQFFQEDSQQEDLPPESSFEREEPPRRPRQRPAQRRMRRMRTRHMGDEQEQSGQWVVERREPWRPPLLHKRSSAEGTPATSGRPNQKRNQPTRQAQRQALPDPEYMRLDPPAKTVNLEALAQQGLPLMNLYQLEPPDFFVYLIRELGIDRKHAKQIHRWLFQRGIQDFTGMHGVPMSIRLSLAKLAAAGDAEWKTLAERESEDGTVKVAYGLPDNHAIESVLMPYQDGRRTACISSQVGCAMGCVFCATGQMGFKRHLTSGEIFEQAARFSAKLRQQGLRLSSVVLLGMGEPLANFDNVVKAVRRIHSELEIGMRHITISTVGLVPEIKRLAKENLQVTLAISLHAANDEERSKLLPMNKRYPVASVMQAAKEYVEVTGRRVSFEWTLIAGENDTPEKAQELGKLIYLNCPGAHVNLIPLNPTNGYAGGPSQREAVAKFVETLRQFGVEATVRVRRGIDIDAGCGQLAERASQEYKLSAIEALPAR